MTTPDAKAAEQMHADVIERRRAAVDFADARRMYEDVRDRMGDLRNLIDLYQDTHRCKEPAKCAACRMAWELGVRRAGRGEISANT